MDECLRLESEAALREPDHVRVGDDEMSDAEMRVDAMRVDAIRMDGSNGWQCGPLF